ncbi:hypothetical protein SmJEL517_g02511 [Synchytrium microbalum]|uniref:Uncharacterized protein n=1 Tax=Synchytrium microbalum TaxID=1806994 RepID=A0A507CBS6_9FUNG|nr:uncharacterized protein SmJEL517_g02511 [Synchytrium microbalum]TPX35003.1 hypothetical protein SmJEL517_g02511 [Synchytrium microbalum]
MSSSRETPDETYETVQESVKDFVEKHWKSIAIGTAAAVTVAALVYYNSSSSSAPKRPPATKGGNASASSKSKGKDKTSKKPVDVEAGTHKAQHSDDVSTPAMTVESDGRTYAEVAATDPDLFVEDVSSLTPQRRAELAKTAKTTGNKLYGEKKYAEAVDLYSQAIRLQPEAVFYSNRAACYANLGKYDEVIVDCTEALKQDPNYIKALNRRATAFDRLGRAKEALNDFTTICIMEEFKSESTVASTDRILKDIGKKMAEELMASKEKRLPSETFITAYMDSFRQTSTQISKITSLKAEQEGDTLVQEAFSLIASRKYKEAYEASVKAIKSGQFSAKFEPLAYNLCGTFHFLKGDIESAMVDFEKSCELDPSNVNSLIKRASIYMERSQVDKTMEEFERAKNVDETDPDLYYHRGQVRFLTNDLAGAAEDYKKSIQLDPDFVYAHIQLGVAQYKMNDVKDAVATFKSAARKFKQSPEVYNYHGEILLDQQSFQDAEENFNKAIQLQPTSPLPYINKAILYLQWKSDTTTAESLCRKATEVDPLCDIAYAQLAQLLLYQMRIEEALENYDKAIAVTRTEPELINAISCREAARAQLHVATNYPEIMAKLARRS